MKKLWLLILICLAPLCFAGCEKKVNLSAPVGLRVDDGIISFERASEVEYYKIYINDFSVNVFNRQSEDGAVVFSAVLDKTYLNYNAKSIFEQGGIFTVAVKAFAGSAESEISTTISYTYTQKLAAPAEIDLVGSNLVWSAVAGAEHYLVSLPDAAEPVQVVSNSIDVSESLTKTGELEFSIIACANKKENSNSISFKYFNSIKLSNPVIQNVSAQGGNLYLTASLDEHFNRLTITANGVQVSKEVLPTSAFLTRVGENYKINLNQFFASAINFNLAGQYCFNVRAEFASNSKPQYTNSNFSLNYVYNNYITLSSPRIALKTVAGQYVLTVSNVASNSVVVRLKVEYAEYSIEVELTGEEEYILSGDFVSVSAYAVGAGYYLNSAESNVINHP